MKHTTLSALASVLLIFALGLSSTALFAHTGEKHADAKKLAAISTEEKAFGRQGDPKKVDRTIKVDMNDMMRFNPSDITVKQGETVKFVVTNSGKVMHEMVLGTMAELKEHGEMMRKHPGMEHDEPYMSHVAPGKTEEMVWQFTKPGEFNYACLVAGHFEAGMTGKVNVVAK